MHADASAPRLAFPLRLRHDTAEGLLQLAGVFALLFLSILCFVLSTPAGIAATFAMTIGLCLVLPVAAPVLLVASFLYQNLLISILSPLVASPAALDAMRGANLVILVTTFSLFVLAAFLETRRLPAPARPWLLGLLAVIGVVVLYLALGALRGVPRDAFVYFRNTFMPLGCFGVGLIAASLYRINIERPLVWIASAALAFGYCELIFKLDFLALFNGDSYLKASIAGRIEADYWERVMKETGFVLRSIEDGMMVPFLNLPLLKDFMPNVFRLSGPNFHPISFAYALAITGVWLMFRGRIAFVVLAVPVLLAAGSKGALVLVAFAALLRVSLPLFGARLAFAGTLAGLGLYLSAAILYGRSVGDYHVLGFFAGIRDFLRNPLGQGLGFGGNLSSSIEGTLDWGMSQMQGIANVPAESAIGVMLYQMGIGAFSVLALLILVVATCRRLFLRTGHPGFLFGFVGVAVIVANGVLQEEAMFSPLALGFCLLLVALSLGEYWRVTAPRSTASIEGNRS